MSGSVCIVGLLTCVCVCGEGYINRCRWETFGYAKLWKVFDIFFNYVASSVRKPIMASHIRLSFLLSKVENFSLAEFQ